ncbi:homoserine O-acetyltransferase MetX [Mycolicibacterium sp. D5.8-2]|uniref:homoserine O-acetyltransferase MetX n=1 Tax=Mycolicibacterium sp. D5.8-2 TaxID=3085903 RepID=UPI00298C0EBA|nr:homoserine O-acetyltransferase [Mycolicibacterium sp. D5.8-2]MDW5609742.1 homoserine O-acetyltransferase [Mycolicibacterium sp. D5.8-2]
MSVRSAGHVRAPIAGTMQSRAALAAIGDLVVESGELLPDVRLFYEAFGDLADDKSNAVLVFHGLAANTHLTADTVTEDPGWWSGVVGPGRGLDTDRLCVISANILGGCYGSTGPTSIAPDGQDWASRFPSLTIRDQVSAAVRLGETLGISTWAGVVGVSFGGMHALEWHVAERGRAKRVAVVAAPWASTAEQLATNTMQTEIVKLDPEFRGGFYRKFGTQPRAGLALARQVGMLQYRGRDEFNDRFGREPQDGDQGPYAIESYFRANGAKFAESFDANSFITLGAAKSSHDIGRGRGGPERALQSSTTPLLVVGIDSDRLFPLDQQRFIARHSRGSVSGDEPVVLHSGHGHDAFLIDQAWMGRTLGEFLC